LAASTLKTITGRERRFIRELRKLRAGAKESLAFEGIDHLAARDAYLLVLQVDSTLNRFLMFGHPSVLTSMQLHIWNEDRECHDKGETRLVVKCAIATRKTVGRLSPVMMRECIMKWKKPDNPAKRIRLLLMF
jgi:hypothetical protein